MEPYIFCQGLSSCPRFPHMQRFTWQHFKQERAISYPGGSTPETLDGWLTLHWQTEDMKKFLGKAFSMSDEKSLTARQGIETCLAKQSSHPAFRLRLATAKDDLEAIGRLVQGLADFEKEPDAVHVTLDDYRNDGFATEANPLFYCLLLDAETDDKTTYTCGTAFCWLGCTLEDGRFWYLDDLFIEEPYRGKGAGTFIMKTLAAIGLSLDCSRLVWQALDWNTPALTFYSKLGAKVVDGLLTTRFADDDLKKFSTAESFPN